ncbi:MAG: hypothetical protein NC177_01980 [Ruminococcus flavefaciens]|nr:hypothetical protein [Ruminococcus flavefaciens]
MKILKDTFIIDRWFYSKPNLTPDKNGNIVLIKKVSFGPLECWEWGIDSDGMPYETYKWSENDLYEDDNYTKHIEIPELKQKLEYMIQSVSGTELENWCVLYRKGLEMI